MIRYQGVDLPDEKDGETAIEAILLLKVMKEDGGIGYREYKTPSLHPVEALGMAETLSDTLRTAIMKGASGRLGGETFGG